jgi:hypothetical protein
MTWLPIDAATAMVMHSTAISTAYYMIIDPDLQAA